MLRAARKDGLNIKVLSAYRSYAHQTFLYMRNVRSAGLIQPYSAKPGHSEHQLGTTIDLVGEDVRHRLKPDFASTPEGKWLRENSHRFGFIQSYREDNQHKTGYFPEPWHFRYVGKAHVKRFL
jgi:D-alanyl-D-alanine carboxypeptidase